jgi:hypothetical protein
MGTGREEGDGDGNRVCPSHPQGGTKEHRVHYPLGLYRGPYLVLPLSLTVRPRSIWMCFVEDRKWNTMEWFRT